MKPIPLILLTLGVAIPATWWVTRSSMSPAASPSASTAVPARRLLYYQSAMHPWIKAPKPGRCTICGMELTPVYEGDAGFDASGGGDLVPLTQTMIQVMHVQTAEASVRPLRRTLNVAGTIDDNTSRHRALSAYIPGRVEKLHVNFLGAEVTEGQPLAEFYSPVLLQTEREFRALTGDLRAATALRLRQMGLAPSQIESLDRKAGDVLTSQILSPIGGTVVLKDVIEGQYVQEGEKLFEIADFSTMWFQFRVYEQDIPWLKPGQKVEVRTPSQPGRGFTGRVAFIDPNFEESTRSTRVRVELENPLVEGRRLLLHRLYAEARVELEAPAVLVVPRSAVIETGSEAVVYVDRGGGAYARRVLVPGRRGDLDLEVLSGLAAGDKVVVNGNLLIDGQAEINRSFAAPAGEAGTGTAPEPPPALTAAQRSQVTRLMELADALGGALASDSLEDYNRKAAGTHEVIPALLAAFPDDGPVRGMLKPLVLAGHLMPATDLKEARKAFHPLSKAAVEVALALRPADPAFATVKVFRCPMTRDSFPGAPSRAEWLQLKPAIRNPYFGAEMLDCGSEVAFPIRKP